MPKQRIKKSIKKQRARKKGELGGLHKKVVIGGKPHIFKSSYDKRRKQLAKINYAKAAEKIRRFESLPFRAKINFSAAEKRVITRRWKVIRYYQNLPLSGKATPELKRTNAVIARGHLVLKKGKGFRRTVQGWYVLDSRGYRREYTVFLSQPEVNSIVGADSPFERFRQVVLTRRPRGFLRRWAEGEIPDDEVHYSWIYGAYPAGRMDEGSFDRYTKQHLEKAEQRQKITALRIIYHIGGFEDGEN
jgi:hypothetical protein